jgi:hypothetical protein
VPRATGNAVLLAEAEGLDWHLVTSSNVAAAAYALDFARLYVEFKPHGPRPAALYVYHKVPRGVYEGLVAAPSAGRYVHAVLRNGGRDNVYAYEQLY